MAGRLLKLAAAGVGKPDVAQRLCGSLQVDIEKPRRLLVNSIGVRFQLISLLPKWDMMAGVRVIAKIRHKKFWEMPQYSDAKGPLESWHDESVKANWASPQDVKSQYGNASICGKNRVVFNIGGNKYRLVVEIQYQAGIVWVKFIGTHAQYNTIDVESINAH